MTDPSSRIAAALSDRYALEQEVGAGGMATVYLARDLRHDRQVAVKVLRPELAAVIGAERFLAEIRTTANLQHPHILPLFDSGEADGLLFYVMPYVEGESLRSRLDREKQLPVADAVRIGGEVAGALDYAHRRGVIHRDIKPENVLLLDGRALVADFGIALAVSTAGGGTRMTETGMSLGTPHYMSPEQAMGERDIGPATDVYALGAVTYELLTGEPPFTGSSAQAIVARVVTEHPRPLTAQRHTIPAHVEAAVLTALEKVPADRFSSAADFAAALTNPAYRGTVSGHAGAAVAARSGARRFLPIAAAAVAGLLIGGGVLAALRPAAAPVPVTRYGIGLPDDQVIVRAVPSPDGSRIIMEQLGDSVPMWIKERDAYDPVPLRGTAGGFFAVWSPDGSAIAYQSVRQLKRLSLADGTVVTLADSILGGVGMTWLDDGGIVFAPRGRALTMLPPDGPVRDILTDSLFVLWPAAVPRRSAVLYSRCATESCGTPEVWGLDIASGRTRRVVTGALRAWPGPDGSLVYVRPDGNVYAAAFDAAALEVRGSARQVLAGVVVVDGAFPLLEISRSGTMVFRRGGALEYADQYELVWVDRTGAEAPVDPGWVFRFTLFGENYGWSLSSDDRRLAIGLSTEQGDDIWVKHLPDGPLSRVTFDTGAEFRPTWMPDGRIMYGSDRARRGTDSLATALYARRADGAGADSLLLTAQSGVYEGRWSPDGRWLVFRTGGDVNTRGGRDIVGIRPGVDTAPVPLIVTAFDERAPMLSPDGQWIAYESDETGRAEVFLRPFPDTDRAKWQISSGGGTAPLWSRTGDELFYVNGSRDMVAVPLAFGAGEPRVGSRRALFRLPAHLYLSPSEFYTPYDVASDGRFIMARQVEPPDSLVAASPVVVVENWFTEVRQRLRQ